MFSEIQPAPTPEAVLTPPEAETQSSDTTAVEKPEKDDRTVPLAALHEERQTRKQLQSEMRALREQQEQQRQEYQVAQQRLGQYLQSLQAPKAPPPDREADPLGYATHVTEQTAAQVQHLAQTQQQKEQWEWQQRQQWEQANAAQAQENQLKTLTAQGEKAFSAVKPDYADALKYARESRAKQYLAIGATPEQAAQMVDRDGWQLAHTALVRGENPAEVIYRLAATMGYQAQTVDVEQRMEMHEAGQKASKASGGAVKGKLTVAQIATMSATELARMPEEDFRRAMGG